ncbi:Thiamine-phosphate synthase [uncultured Mycobacterium sp.]|uniref:Thiamine-phosphate synthase n=1 Tax=uncultured Mycobacterium sp. TaxID=171292 RepID=A0A1Y5P9D7_9MYCO|nr:Thiamine-phosphate synthase [uncultured Mycobacterium sp.]
MTVWRVSRSTLSPAPGAPVPALHASRYRRGVHEPQTRLATARLYLCTDARRERGDLAEFAEAALAGGVDLIQLRDKGSPGERQFGPLEARDELAALEVLADAAHRHGALLAVNDRADICRAAGADVLHLGQDDLPLAVARDIVGPHTVIGRSTHAIGEAARAQAEDVDYFCVGPCWPTPTKPGRSAPGLDLVRAVAATAPDKPWFAIGGIDEARLPEVLDAGASRIVVVRAITAADDPKAAATRLRAALDQSGPAS